MKTVLARLGRFCLVVYMWKFMILLYIAYGYNVLCLQYLTVNCAVNALLFILINGFSWRHPFVWHWPLSLSIFIPIPGSVYNYMEKFSSRLFQARSQQPDQPTCSYKRREITSIKYRFRPINSKNIEELKYWNYCLLITVPSKFIFRPHKINSLILITTLSKWQRGGRFQYILYCEVSQTEINIVLHEQWLNTWTECEVPLKCNEMSFKVLFVWNWQFKMALKTQYKI
jgi:hypothetical protein